MAFATVAPSSLKPEVQIGRGSYGSVYTATFGERRVAVKVMPLGDSGDIDGFKREIKMLKACNSKWIVRYFGCLAKADMVWICMELCDGGSVHDVLRKTGTPMLEDEIAMVCAAAVSGLHYLHETRKILHRDVKCGNILLSTAEGGGVKLCDLGVAAWVASHNHKTTIGTPLWMSPELIKSEDYGTPTDIWSLGITLLEMAELNPPHHEVLPTIRALFRITSLPPPRLKDTGQWSAELHELVAACLVKEPKARASAATLLATPFVQRGKGLGMRPLQQLLARAAAAPSRGAANHATLDLMKTCEGCRRAETRAPTRGKEGTAL